MSQPEGFVEPGKEKKFCKLVKSLYGLKQAPKQWHEKFDQVVLSYGFQINNTDKCVYVKQFDDNGCVILCLYVDDILIFGSNMHFINDVKSLLFRNFDIKDLGQVDVILGIKLIKKNDDMTFTQSYYVEKLLKKFNYFDAKHVFTPYDSSIKLKKNLSKGISSHKYSQIIDSLLHLTNFSRPDIAYAVGRLGRYTNNPDHSHWIALERVFRYLKGTINYGIHYTCFPAVIEGFSDANWIYDSDETKSTSGYVFTLAGGAVSWKSAKQTIISRSTMEA